MRACMCVPVRHLPSNLFRGCHPHLVSTSGFTDVDGGEPARHDSLAPLASSGLLLLMAALKICTYNPLCAHGDRLLDIAKTIKADVIGLPGTMYRNYNKEQPVRLSLVDDVGSGMSAVEGNAIL